MTGERKGQMVMKCERIEINYLILILEVKQYPKQLLTKKKIRPIIVLENVLQRAYFLEMKLRGAGMIVEHLSLNHTRQTRQTTKVHRNLILGSRDQDICFPRRPLLTSRNRFILNSNMFLQLTNKFFQCCVTWCSGTSIPCIITKPE